VRECHGDLHLRNAVVLDATQADGVVAFDGLEFDPALRWIDVQSDLAFMTMDLQAHRRDDLAMRWLDAWLTVTGDVAGMALQRFYAVYRALVRAMVGRLHPEVAPEPTSDDYLALARRLALRPDTPRLLVTHGLSGSGKSWLTLRLLERCGALRLRSDVERKRLHGLAAQERSADHVPGGIYGAEATERTYAALRQGARALLAAGWPVIVDAACLRRAERDAFRALAAESECALHAARLPGRARDAAAAGATAPGSGPGPIGGRCRGAAAADAVRRAPRGRRAGRGHRLPHRRSGTRHRGAGCPMAGGGALI
jgi:predicted kinase